jgi:hypothetical protein
MIASLLFYLQEMIAVLILLAAFFRRGQLGGLNLVRFG